MYCNAIILLAVVATAAYGSVVIPLSPGLDGRIVGGIDTTIESFPYQVSVRAFGLHLCGGSIVNERVVITAAHCIYRYLPATCYSIQYGISVIGGSKNIISAERIVQNENYRATNFNNDIALIFLVSGIPFSAVAKPIRLASVAPATGKSAVATGYGALFEGGSNAPILQQVSVKIIDNPTCRKCYKGINDVIQTMLCAGVTGGGRDACKDDSGGPLVSDGFLVGIISYGFGCGDPKHPGVYTNVAAFKNWINSNIYG